MVLPISVRTLPARALHRLASFPAEAALRVINTAPIERRLSQHYDQIRQAHAPRIPALSEEDFLIVRALEKDGVHVTSLDILGLPVTAEMFAQASALSRILAERTMDTRTTRSATARDLLAHPTIFQWGITARLLGIAEAYLGLPVAYDGFCYFYSLPDGAEAGIRLWHIDREDRRQIKLGIYVTDVGEADGPLQYVSPNVTRQLEPKLYCYKPVTHAELARRLSPAAVSDVIKTIVGPAGTVIFMDTAAQFHRGSPPTARPRAAIYHSYFARPPRHPFFCERSPFSRSQLTALVENATPDQRDAVQWRTALVRPAKWFPRSRS
jgi:hypothetical protein